MNSYRAVVTVGELGQVVIKDVPFPRGEQVEVIVLPAKQNGSAAADELKMLLKETQALPRVKVLTDAEIDAEIAAYRSAR